MFKNNDLKILGSWSTTVWSYLAVKSVFFWKSSLLSNKFYCVCNCINKILSIKNMHIAKTKTKTSFGKCFAWRWIYSQIFKFVLVFLSSKISDNQSNNKVSNNKVISGINFGKTSTKFIKVQVFTIRFKR